MQRRRFVQMLTIAGAGTLAAIETPRFGETRTVSWHVNGFTCVTCAVGLETMLQQRKGVKWVKATYPEAMVTLKYDPRSVTPEQLRSLIADLGFRVDSIQPD
jgi:copper chaperone CopZ